MNGYLALAHCRRTTIGTDMSMIPVLWDDGTPVMTGTVIYSKNYGNGTISSVNNSQRTVTFSWSKGNTSVVNVGTGQLSSIWKTPIGTSQSAPTSTPVAPLTPQQLLSLDRKLTPAEQKIVDDFQAGQANAMQSTEEKKIYIDPATGEHRTSSVTYTPGSTPTSIPQFTITPIKTPTSTQFTTTESHIKKGLATILITGSIAGLTAGGLCAWAWPAHRILGFALGAFLIGPPIGYGVGAAIAAERAV